MNASPCELTCTFVINGDPDRCTFCGLLSLFDCTSQGVCLDHCMTFANSHTIVGPKQMKTCLPAAKIGACSLAWSLAIPQSLCTERPNVLAFLADNVGQKIHFMPTCSRACNSMQRQQTALVQVLRPRYVQSRSQPASKMQL